MKNLNFILFLGAFALLALASCTKQDPAINPITTETGDEADERGVQPCNCNLKVTANMAGSNYGTPWVFELYYLDGNGVGHLQQAFANGTTNYPLSIKKGSTQQWTMTAQNPPSNLTVTARLECGGEPISPGGKVKTYNVPAGTVAYGNSDTSTNPNCSVQ